MAAIRAIQAALSLTMALISLSTSSDPSQGLTSPPAPARPNVLFLVSDDLRPDLRSAYGVANMITPNLDKLAAKSLVFERAYTNMAICSASRNSFMTSRRPDHTQVWNFINDFRQSKYWETDSQTLPEYFKSNGYLTLGAGKLYHPQHPPNNDEPKSWSQDRPYFPPYKNRDWNATLCPRESLVCVRPEAQAVDSEFADYNETVETVNNLKLAAEKLKEKQQPFFIGLGVTKPHAKWNVPERFYSQYINGSFPLPRNEYSPVGVPAMAFTAEFDGQENISLGNSTACPGSRAEGLYMTWPVPSPNNNTIPDWATAIIRAGYHSAVSLADYHLGMALDALEDLNLTDSTIVVMLADHGYSLMEHTELAKHTNFETALNVPLMVHVPWLPATHGARESSFVELLDVFPTLAALANLPKPTFPVDGDDMSALFTGRGKGRGGPGGRGGLEGQGKTAAFSQYSRCPDQDAAHCSALGNPFWCENNCEGVVARNMTSMGYSIRVHTWRYTGWYAWDKQDCVTQWAKGPVYGEELYKHDDDVMFPITYDKENENVAGDASYADTMTQLRNQLESHFAITDVRGCPPDQPSA